MLKYYWYISTFARKHGIVFLLSIIAAILIFSLALPFFITFLEAKKKSYVGVVGSYSLDNLPPSIQDELSLGLTKVTESGTVTPALAERWNTEDEGKTYRFLLKKNIVWQDGKNFSSQDVNYALDNVKIITTPNEVIFKLNDPLVTLPMVVSQPLFRRTVEPYFFFFKREKLLGLGKFQMVSYEMRGQRLKQLTVDSPDEQKIYRFYLTEEDAVDAFKRGEVDILPNFVASHNLENWPTISIAKNVAPQTYLGVFFNTTSPLLSSNELRQALNYATAKPTDETRAYGPINPKSWAFANVGKQYDFDMDRAVERLLVTRPAEPIQIELTTTPLFVSDAESLKKQWEELGQKASQKCQTTAEIKDKNICQNFAIEIHIRINNFPDLQDFQALLIGQESPADPDQYALWHSDQPTNFTHYKNTRIDSLLERGRQTEDQDKRFEIYQDFQQFFSEDAPVIFLRHLYRYDIKRNGR